MANMRKDKVPMTEAAPDIRNKNWEEVAKGYTESEAIEEASRCLQCKHKPCVNGCPVAVRIPEFIDSITKKDFAQAYQIIKSTNSLPAICGRVCPQESQCENKCVRGIKGESVAIGRLERFCADWANDNNIKTNLDDVFEPNGIKIAVIGAGPAGLTCAGDLAVKGYDVTVFEALHMPGGVLVYGIPEFRLPKNIVQKEIDDLRELGVKIKTDMVIGRILSIDDLFDEGYQAIFIGSGAGLPSFLSIPGENSNNVYSANEFLTRINLMKAYDSRYETPIKSSKNTIVVGGGNVAMDAARCSKRLGTDNVYIVYRRSEAEMPARLEEVHHAKEEGIIFKMLTNPTRINADEQGNVTSVTCVQMTLCEPDESGRCNVQPIPDTEFDIVADTVIVAVGTSPNPLIRMTTPGLEVNNHGCIIVKADGVSTSCDGVFAGGDTVSGAATVILAMGAGKDAAVEIDNYIKKKGVSS